MVCAYTVWFGFGFSLSLVVGRPFPSQAGSYALDRCPPGTRRGGASAAPIWCKYEGLVSKPQAQQADIMEAIDPGMPNMAVFSAPEESASSRVKPFTVTRHFAWTPECPQARICTCI